MFPATNCTGEQENKSMNHQERFQFLLSRPQLPTDEAARFVETRIAVPSQLNALYSERSGNFVTVEQGRKEEQISAEMWREADKEKEELFNLMEQVQNKFEDKGSYRLSGPELRRCKWEQVMDQVHETSRRWKSSPRRTSRAMQCIDKLGQNSEAFKSWLDLLPAGDYGASIAGVFTIVIGAAGRYTKVEDAIFQALSDIPEILERSRRYVTIYANLREHALEKRTYELFRSILRTLCHIMRFFKEGTLRKISESFLKQDSYKEELTASLEEVSKNSDRIQDEANQCLAWRQLQQEGMLLQVNNKADEQLHLLQSIMYLLRANPVLAANTAAALSATDNSTQQTPPGQDIAAVAGFLSDQSSEPKTYASSSFENLNRDSLKIVSARHAAKRLLKCLSYDPSITTNDVDACLRLGETLDEYKKARSAAMIGHPRFIKFMAEHLASSSLLVNGREDLSSTEGLSSLSFVAAKLARISEGMVSPSESAYVVKYFCNQRPCFMQESAASPPTTMMASLVGQLLTQMSKKKIEIDLSNLSKGDWQKVEKLNLKALCNTFYELTCQLPPKSILLCIIDDINQYEIAPLMKETDVVIRRLTRLAAGHHDIVFKLLVTCQGRALEVSKYFVDQTMDMDEEIEPDDSSSWRISTLDR